MNNEENKKQPELTERISVFWDFMDVHDRGNSRGIELNRKACAAILDLIVDNYDSTVGINWETLDKWTDYYLEHEER